jgi:hypothetical protein
MSTPAVPARAAEAVPSSIATPAPALAPARRNPVFVLGDSRTGTMSLHRFLKRAGYNSIHYFFAESGVSEPAHLDPEGNWQRLRHFIETSGHDAFSDYPLRSFYRQLFETWPEAHFILTTRHDLETWQASMKGFFGRFGRHDLDIPALTGIHIRLNAEIRALATATGAPFCEICIDEDAAANGARLSEFLDLPEPLPLGWENRTRAYDPALWSGRVSMMDAGSADPLAYVRQMVAPGKAMLSEQGWVFLINDSNDYLDHALGGHDWPAFDRACETLQGRHARLEERGIGYLKVAVPEKAAVYPQYLPRALAGLPLCETRPAARLAAAGLTCFSYPLPLLQDAGSYGPLYFRGDSHPNWLGAWFLYQHVATLMNARLSSGGHKVRAPLSLSELACDAVGYGGDLFGWLDAEARAPLAGPWAALNLQPVLEHVLRYRLPEDRAGARPAPPGPDYPPRPEGRGPHRFVHADKTLPRAVIFRDSMTDFMLPLLAEHFSESLFIWQGGQVFEDIIAREAPDIVLHVMAERFLVQYDRSPVFCRFFGDP